jgi:predicted ATP-dependent serine protease
MTACVDALVCGSGGGVGSLGIPATLGLMCSVTKAKCTGCVAYASSACPSTHRHRMKGRERRTDTETGTHRHILVSVSRLEAPAHAPYRTAVKAYDRAWGEGVLG